MQSDTIAYISASGISNEIEISAVDELVKSLKSSGIWSKMKSIYPNMSIDLKSIKIQIRKDKIKSIFK